jgi:hypothetical protein
LLVAVQRFQVCRIDVSCVSLKIRKSQSFRQALRHPVSVELGLLGVLFKHIQVGKCTLDLVSEY